MNRYRPEDHLVPPTALTGYRHPTALTTDNVVRAGAGGIAAGIVASGVLTGAAEALSAIALGGTFWALPSFLVGTVALGGLAYVRSMHLTAVKEDKSAMSDLESKARHALSTVTLETRNPHALVLGSDERTDAEKTRQALDADALKADYSSIVTSNDPRLAELRRITILRLAAMHVAFSESIAIMGSAPKDELMQVMCEGLRRALAESVDRREAIVGYARPSALGGPTIVDAFRESISMALALGAPEDADGRGKAGTGHARFDRLIARGEEALAIDPDMVDAAGARVDAALREHLPRLLRTHAESARHARLDDLEDTDRQLEIGVEQIRSSLEEGLRTLRHDRADALRTEVAFLRMRRAGLEGPLRAIGCDDAA